jgi:RND superfamily putative drug exporter
MSRSLYALGRLAARRPLLTVAAWVLLAVAVVAGSAAFGRALDDSFGVPGSDSQRAERVLQRAGADEAGLTAQVVVTPREPGATFAGSPRAREAAQAVRDSLAALPNALGVSDPMAEIAPGGGIARMTIQYPVLEGLTGADLDRLKDALAGAREGPAGRTLRIEANGDLFFAFEEPENGVGELAGVLVAAVVLLIAFGSLIAMGLPILLAVSGLALALGALPLIGHVIEIPTWAPILAAMVGLGVGIDYALLLVSRHREQLAQGMEMRASVALATATAGRSVVFAGGTVLVAILGLAVAGLPFLTAAGVAIAVVVLVTVSASVTLLPALLAMAGPWIDRLAVRPRRRASATAGPRWERWAGHVARNPRRYLVASTALLLALAAPVLALRLGQPDDGTLPESRTERRAYDLVAAGFGPGVNGPFVVAVDTAGDAAAVGSLRAALGADPGIATVGPATADARTGIVSMVAVPRSAPQDAATRDTLVRLRADVIPAALAGSPAQASVGGQTAVFIDAADRVADRLALFIGAVVGLSLLLLVVVFRSIVVPLKAAVLNLLSIGAAYGVIVMVFQWGWGASLIGVESTVPIVSFIPMFMFAIVFGLSMDYEVFLLSRIREHYLATGDTHASVVRGLASTGRVITSAALIMVSVFLGFVAGADPSTKMFGLGLATAILVDATIVRTVLVPAAMTLLGRANWWLPGPLERLLPAEGRDRAPRVPGAAPQDAPVVATARGDVR